LAYLKKSSSERLTLPSNPEFWVEMKRVAQYGDTLAAQSAMLKLSTPEIDENGASKPVTMVTALEYKAYVKALTVALITAWNLTDADDQPLPIDEASLALLEPRDGEFLAAKATERSRLRPGAQQDPFSAGSGSR
jgi:hypothetical protein